MIRRYNFLAGLGLFSAFAASFAVPVSQSLFPTTVGSTWTIRSVVTGMSTPIDMQITIVRAKNPTPHQVVLRYMKGDKEFQEETYLVTASEVARMRSGPGGSGKITPPLPVIKYPATVGKSWKWAGSITQPTSSGGSQTVQGNATIKIAAFEAVKTTMGSIKAYKVDLNLVVTAGGQSATIVNSYWYAPNIGMIKQAASFGNGTSIEGTVTSYKIK